MEQGAEIANARVVQRLFQLIMQGSTPATIFWLKARAGWKEGQTIAIEREPDQPAIDYSKLTDAERRDLRATLTKAVAANRLPVPAR